ncbi:MAG: hypothetical protein KC594_18145, partial [Nitrospira sp.]|nr:hypothetical protein [Nitrospira sp.]
MHHPDAEVSILSLCYAVMLLPSWLSTNITPPYSRRNILALFEPFPNYVWNLSVSIALENGGKIGEIVDIIKPLMEKAESGEDAGTQDFMIEWVKMADKLVSLGEEDLEKGREFSAGNKFKRSSIYYLTGERMQGLGHPGREET